jgi:hypothetical protein
MKEAQTSRGSLKKKSSDVPDLLRWNMSKLRCQLMAPLPATRHLPTIFPTLPTCLLGVGVLPGGPGKEGASRKWA